MPSPPLTNWVFRWMLDALEEAMNFLTNSNKEPKPKNTRGPSKLDQSVKGLLQEKLTQLPAIDIQLAFVQKGNLHANFRQLTNVIVTLGQAA
ncbi:hypothetical protein VP01_1169g2 [Puccinia sorghi]|uniref:Uncharacterized protein n=1 Tax=Puccinia sorghi TaxID=27349 RepID=A0A0L6VRA2_9BASI|nr:hypothetical protein VP01_1169g2 [Puccinia sorghi]